MEAETYDLDFLTVFTHKEAISIPSGIILQGELSYAPDTLHTLCTLMLDHGSATLEAGYHLTDSTYTLQLTTDSLDLRHFLPHEEIAMVSLQTRLVGSGLDYRQSDISIHGTLKLYTLQWREYTYSNAEVQIALANNRLHAHASYSDSLMQWNLTTSAKHATDTIEANLHAQVTHLDMKALQITDTDIRPALHPAHTVCRARHV
jgi:hypothetical protein